MMQNPFQSLQTDPTLGAYSGIANPFALPFTAMQTATIHPALNPFAAIPGMSSYATVGVPQLGQQGPTGGSNYAGLHPQQLAALQSQWIPAGLQNPWLPLALQNSLWNAILAQQLIPAPGPVLGLQSYAPHQQIAAHGPQLSPLGQPFAQPGLPYVPVSPLGQVGPVLAPQTFVGQAGPLGGGQTFGQIHPLLAQLGARQFQTPGIAPWAGF
jgi:hypothetical protein